jgi:hypothetical protein
MLLSVGQEPERDAASAEFWHLVAAWDQAHESDAGLQHRDPIPVSQVVDAVRLHVVDGVPWKQVERLVGL